MCEAFPELEEQLMGDLQWIYVLMINMWATSSHGPIIWDKPIEQYDVSDFEEQQKNNNKNKYVILSYKKIGRQSYTTMSRIMLWRGKKSAYDDSPSNSDLRAT